MQNPTVEPDGVRFAVVGDRRNGVDRLSLIGTLDRDTVLLNLASVDLAAVFALEAMARVAAKRGWLLFLVHCPEPSLEVFERAGSLGLLSTDVSDVLSGGDGDWEPISLSPPPWHRAHTPGLRILEGHS